MEHRSEDPDGLTDRERDALGRRRPVSEADRQAALDIAARTGHQPPPAVRDLVAERAVAGLCIAAPGAGLLQCPTSLDLSTDEGQTTFLNAMNAPDLVLDNQGEALVEIRDWLAYPRQDYDEESGETREYSCLVLIQPDGSRFATTSPVVAHRLAQAVRLRRQARFDPPLSVVIRARLNRSRTKTYHEMEVIGRGQ